MRVLKILIPAAALILAVVIPVLLFGPRNTETPHHTPYGFTATIPNIPDYSNPASLLWANVKPVTEVVVNEETQVVESVEAPDVGQLIADFGVFLAEAYGNGVGGATNKFRYSISGSGVFSREHGYDTFSNAEEHLSQIANDELDYMYISCIAFASFCQKKILGDLVYYDLGCSRAGLIHYKDVIEGNGIFWPDPAAYDYVKENAHPGDILLYTDSNTTMPLDKINLYVHAELYIGQYGDWDYACVGSNIPGTDVSIKSLQSTLYSGHTRVWLVPLSKWLELNDYTVVADSDVDLEELAKEVS